MKRLRIIGVALLALFALGAFVASMASAEEGLLPQQGTKAAGGEGGKAKLQTGNKSFIECQQVSILDILFLPSSDVHGTADIHFKQCTTTGGAAANSLGDGSGIILQAVLFLVCLTNSTTLLFGLLIQPLTTAHIEAPLLGVLLLVKGAVIAENLSGLKGEGEKGLKFKYSLKGKEGKQTEATECEIGGKKFKHTFESGVDSGADEAASEEAAFTITYTAAVELMDT